MMSDVLPSLMIQEGILHSKSEHQRAERVSTQRKHQHPAAPVQAADEGKKGKKNESEKDAGAPPAGGGTTRCSYTSQQADSLGPSLECSKGVDLGESQQVNHGRT